MEFTRDGVELVKERVELAMEGPMQAEPRQEEENEED